MDREKNLSAFMRESHAVDESGNPLRLYHGTADDFSEFRHGHPNKKDAGWLGRGFYFTNSPAMANSYAMLKPGKAENVMPVHLSLKNPFYATMEHKTALKNALMDDPYAAEEFRNKLMEAGHDGVILDYGTKDNVREYVAFDPTQIKSATGNQGTFDPSKPDITKNDGGGVKGYIPHDDERRAKNLADFHGETPEEIKTARWFHGTNKDFSSFQPRTADAIYVTQSPAFAQQFSKQHMENWHESAPEPPKGSALYTGSYAKPKVHAPNIMPVHVRAEKPFDYENPKHVKDVVSKLGYLGLSDSDRDLLARYLPIGDWESIESGPVQDVLKASGYDSFFVEEDGHKNLAVYKPEQLKSATGNQGTFDPEDPDITKAGGGEVDDEGITAYHGSPHDFEQFDTSKIGTGEGAQAYGHGLYFAEREPIAQWYKETLSNSETPYHGKVERVMQKLMDAGVSPMDSEIMSSLAWEGGFDPEKNNIHEFFKSDDEDDDDYSHHLKNPKVVEAIHEYTRRPTPRMYEVAINAHPDHFMDYNKPFAEQSEYVKERAQKAFNKKLGPNWYEHNEREGTGIYDVLDHLHHLNMEPQHLSKMLNDEGIAGIKYLDSDSMHVDKPGRKLNYVVFDHDRVKIKRKYARGGVVG